MSRNDTSPRQTRATVSRFLSNIMQPLARILMRYGYSAREAGDVVRWSFVHSYFETAEFWETGRPTFTQGAIKTGLPRQQVNQLSAMPTPDESIFATRQNLAYRVVEGWVNDPHFHLNGAPAPLPITHRTDPCFKTLVMKYGNDVTYGPVLKDLESAGCVQTKDGVAVLINETYGLNLLHEDRMDLTGHMLKRMVETTGHNLTHENVAERRMQRMWRQTLIPREEADQARKIISEIAIRAGREADARLSELAHVNVKEGIDYVEIGLVAFIYEDAADRESGDFDNNNEKGSSSL